MFECTLNGETSYSGQGGPCSITSTKQRVWVIKLYTVCNVLDPYPHACEMHGLGKGKAKSRETTDAVDCDRFIITLDLTLDQKRWNRTT